MVEIVSSGEISPLQSLTRFRVSQPSNTVKQLCRETVEVLSNFGRPHGIVQGLAHQRRHVMELIGRILICDVEESGANLIAMLLHQIFKAVRIAGRATRRSPDASTASAMLRPKPLALPVTSQTLDMKIPVLLRGCTTDVYVMNGTSPRQ